MQDSAEMTTWFLTPLPVTLPARRQSDWPASCLPDASDFV